MPLVVSFHRVTWEMSTFVIYDSKYAWKRKNLWTHDPAGIFTSGVSVYCVSNVKLRAGWFIFLCHFSENECSEQVSENFRNGKIFPQE